MDGPIQHEAAGSTPAVAFNIINPPVNRSIATPGGHPLHVKPDLAEVHYNLGKALSQMPGHLPDAIAEYETALRCGGSTIIGASGLQLPSASIHDI